MRTTIMVLAFFTMMPGIFLLCLAMLQKMEQSKELNALEERKKQRLQADSDSAWIRNKQTYMQ